MFLAERLVAQFPSEPNLLLLATCYHRSGQTFRCYALLRGLSGEASRYLFAVCCVELGKITEAEGVLLVNSEVEAIPNGAAGVYLLGRVYQLSNRHSLAVREFQRALQMDPLMWCAFEQLCALSPDADAKRYLEMVPTAMEAAMQYDTAFMTPVETLVETPVGSAVPMDVKTAVLPHRPPLGAHASHPTAQTPAVGPGLDYRTPEMVAVGSFETPHVAPQVAQPPVVKKGSKERTEPCTNQTPVVSPMLLSGSQFLDGRKFLDEGTVRKISSKLFSEPATALKIAQAHVSSPRERLVEQRNDASGDGGGDQGGERRGRRGEGGLGSGTIARSAGKSLRGQAACISLLQLLGEGYRYLSMYECEKAIEAFSKVPLPHYSTGWVLHCVGQAYFEMVDYHAAEKTFQQLRLLDPYRLEGLEVYSTVLWHMKKEVELSGLAQEAIALDRQSPMAWCIMGNCFSLQKEHETALRFFQRSLQLDPMFTYAYTLCGHEYFANEDFDKGLTCYRNAIRLNPRHYNAWFGSGHIYFRQEKYGMAEYHFRRAHLINPRSSVLKCYLGMALHKVKRTGEAIQTLKQAVSLDPKNPLARFEYASVLASVGDLDRAVAELTQLHGIVPREASVLFQKGKVLKRLGRLDEALQCFSDALDLQPPRYVSSIASASFPPSSNHMRVYPHTRYCAHFYSLALGSIDTNLIKSAIDRISLDDGEEEDI